MTITRPGSTLWGAVKATSVAALLATTALTGPARAADSSTAALQKQIQMLKEQIQQLQDQLNQIQSNEQTTNDAVAKEAAQRKAYEDAEKSAILNAGGKVVANNGTEVPVPASPPPSAVTNSGIKLTFGGFAAMEGVYRNRYEAQDIGSSFKSLLFPNSPQYHLSEFRGTARQSRLSLLAEGDPDDKTKLTAYFEMDFLAAPSSANSQESNSYSPRIRLAYAAVDRNMGDDMGFHFAAGQLWTLATMNKVGLLPRTEQVPLTIDAQYVVGFNWLRNPEVRAVWDWDKKWWFAVAADSPQAVIAGTAPSEPSTAPLTASVSGSGQLSNAGTTLFTVDPGPDVTVKAAADPGFGHYEVYGLLRWFRDRVDLANETSHGEGVGGSALLPIVPNDVLNAQGTFLIGKGLGRYGTGQFADVTYNTLGQLVPLPYRSAMLGLVSQAVPAAQLYLYGGTEQVERKYFGSGSVGYANPNGITTSGCETESVGTCSQNNAREYMVAGGLWYSVYKGSYGNLKFGLQNSYEQLYIFSGKTGGAPHTNIDMTFFSIRYYPF